MASLSLISQTLDTNGKVIEPATLDETKKALRIENYDDEDALLLDYITAARERVETETYRQLIDATWELRMDAWPVPGAAPFGFGWAPGTFGLGYQSSWFPGWPADYQVGTDFLDIPRAPLGSITSITYVDLTGTTQTWDPSQYDVDAPVGPRGQRGRVAPKYGIAWPAARYQMNAIVVRFVAGYGATADAVPRQLKRAMFLIIGEMFENREDLFVARSRSVVMPLPYGASAICQQHRARPIRRAA